MPNFLNVSGTESGLWFDGSVNYDQYTHSIPGTNLFFSNAVMTWNFSDTMILTYTGIRHDHSTSKQYYIYFTTPNDGLTRQYRFDVGISIPNGYLTDGLTTFSAPLNPFELTKNIGSLGLHHFISFLFWTSSPQSYSQNWTSSNPSPAILPNTTVRCELLVGLSHDYPYASVTCPFSGSVIATCLNPTTDDANIVQMIL
jgi:hypothetical protein